MKFPLVNRVYIGFIVLFLLSVTIGLTDYFTIKKQERISKELNRTYRVINATENVQNLLIDMETGRRGYRCTNQQIYLEPYYFAMEQIGPVLADLSYLTSRDNSAIKNVQQLEGSVNGIVRFWSQLRTEEARYDSADVARITAEEKDRMDDIRTEINNILSAEHTSQTASENENNRILAYISWSSPTGSLLEQVFILMLIYLVINELQKRRKAEAGLQKALVKEKQLNELKSRFVSMASHEFRTPLAAILASTYLAAKYKTEEDQPKREKHYERIGASVHNLTEILEDLLSVDKLEVGKIEMKPQEFNIEGLIQSVIHDFDFITKECQQIVFEHSGASSVILDPALLRRILTNLLSNAVKFSGENTVINISSCYSGKQLVISVKDAGIGIPDPDMEHLFERFHRGTNVSAIGGTGLGLHIVAKYTKLMAGDIQCISTEGAGTEFILTFPQTHNNAESSRQTNNR